jgi:hypothetical protein
MAGESGLAGQYRPYTIAHGAEVVNSEVKAQTVLVRRMKRLTLFGATTAREAYPRSKAPQVATAALRLRHPTAGGIALPGLENRETRRTQMFLGAGGKSKARLKSRPGPPAVKGSKAGHAIWNFRLSASFPPFHLRGGELNH